MTNAFTIVVIEDAKILHAADVDLAQRCLPFNGFPIFNSLEKSQEFAAGKASIIYEIDAYTEGDHLSAYEFVSQCSDREHHYIHSYNIKTIHGICIMDPVNPTIWLNLMGLDMPKVNES